MPARFNYWHVELEKHECIVANGVPAESFIDYVGRSGFDNDDEYLDLVGADRLIAEMPLARISARRLLPANGLRGLPAIARRPLIAVPGKPPPDATRMANRAAAGYNYDFQQAHRAEAGAFRLASNIGRDDKKFRSTLLVI